MTQRNENVDEPFFDLEATTMDIAALTAPQESVDRVVRDVLAGVGESSDQMLTRSKRRSRRRTLAGILALTSAIVVICVIAISMPTSGIAFAQAQQQLERTHSVQYVEYMNDAAARKELQQAKNMLQSANLEREASAANSNGVEVDRIELQKQFQEQTKKLQDYIEHLSTSLEKGKPIELRRVWILGRSMHRAEQSTYGSKSVFITNAETGESVNLQLDRKQCIRMTTQTVLNTQSGEKTVTSIGPNPARNFYSQFTEISSEGVTSVGYVLINGKEAIVFEQSEERDGNVLKRSYWVDPVTQLPIRIDAVLRRDGIVIGGAKISDIIFDQDLDPGLFSTTPPEGFAVSEGGFMSIDPGAKKEVLNFGKAE